MNTKNKEIIIFDLDDTLTESKQNIDEDMSILIIDLLKIKKVAIISGAGFKQLNNQVISRLNCDASTLKNLYIFPTSGAIMYKYNTDWIKVYENTLSPSEKILIKESFNSMLKQIDFLPQTTYGQQLEDRDTQFTFSALGQESPIELKKEWDTDMKKRTLMKGILDKYLYDFEVKIGGSTSIDITKKSINKAYAVEKIKEELNIDIEKMLFIGDAIFEGGNDYSVVKTGVSYISVKNKDETKKIITDIINNNQ